MTNLTAPSATKTITVDTPVTLWWHGTEADCIEFDKLLAERGAPAGDWGVADEKGYHNWYTIPTTVRDAMTIHDYGTDLYDGYFMEDEQYPNAEQELNDIYDTLFPNA